MNYCLFKIFMAVGIKEGLPDGRPWEDLAEWDLLRSGRLSL